MPRLEAAGHAAIAVDLPTEHADAGWSEYADTVVRAVGPREDVVVVGHSLGGFTAPLAAERLGARLIVLVSAMVAVPGETGMGWWESSGWAADVGASFDDDAIFFHDVEPALAEEARRHERDVLGPAMEQPFAGWPEGIPVRAIAFADDRVFPVAFQARVARERLGLDLTLVPGGHYGTISAPESLSAALLALST